MTMMYAQRFETPPPELWIALAGESFCPGYPENLARLRGLFDDSGGEGLSAVLLREPNNPYDSNAIAVHVPAIGGRIGYVPAGEAESLAPILDAGHRYLCEPFVAVKDGLEDRPGAYVRGSLVTEQ